VKIEDLLVGKIKGVPLVSKEGGEVIVPDQKVTVGALIAVVSMVVK